MLRIIPSIYFSLLSKNVKSVLLRKYPKIYLIEIDVAKNALLILICNVFSVEEFIYRELFICIYHNIIKPFVLKINFEYIIGTSTLKYYDLYIVRNKNEKFHFLCN